MAKQSKPITFEKIGPNLYRTPSRSEPGAFYNVGVVSDGYAACCCYAANHRGRCAHADALVAQGLAVLEPVEHITTIRDDVPGTNFAIECSCGYWINIATLDRSYVEQRAREHSNPPPRPSLF